jgi:aminopeptidase N
VTTADFVRLAEKRSGRQLDAFFDTWLYQPVKPTTW